MTVDVGSPRAISPMLYGQNYYNWIPAWGAQVLNVEDMVVPLKLNLLRAGGIPSDISDPAGFGHEEIDTFVRYAADVGATPLLQIPFVAMRDATGALVPSTSASAAALVEYMNVTHGYDVKYFSIGNEPEYYEDQGRIIAGESTVGYTAERFCSAFSEYVTAMKAVDPSIQFLGPEVSARFQDWLPPFLQKCGSLVDVVTVHRYPFSSAQDTAEAVYADAPNFRSMIRNTRELMATAGCGDKPLGITEAHVTWDTDPAKPQLSGAPGSTAAGLWIADSLGVAMEEGLWTLAFWSISEAWTVGFIDGRSPKPEYYSMLMVGQHFRSKIASVTGAPADVSVYAGRNDAATPVLFANKTAETRNFTIAVVGTPAPVAKATVAIPPFSAVVVEVPDNGPPSAWVYGQTQKGQGIGPQPLELGSPAKADGGSSPDVATEAGPVPAASCDGGMPSAEGNLSVTNDFVVAGPLHGYATAWTWVGSRSSAIVCAVPACVSPGSLQITAVTEEGAAPLTTDAVTCTPAFASSALCTAGTVTADSTYESVAGLGFNLSQDTVDDASATATTLGGVMILKSIAITIQKTGEVSQNTALRVQLTDSNDHFFCALEGQWTSGTAIPITQFNTKCWDNTGAYATPSMSFKRVDILVPSTTSGDRGFSYCLTSVAVE